MGNRSGTEEEYWKDYDGLQGVKHRILARYLDAWFAILSKIRGQLLYLDCHAGRGRHSTGDPGSPILVLEQLRGHRLLPQILDRVSIACHFFELDKATADRLENEISGVGALDSRISVRVHPTDYEAALSRALDRLETTGTDLPPSFAFIDPYGFKLSMRFMNRLLSAGRTETLINFMYRYVDMAVPREPMAEIRQGYSKSASAGERYGCSRTSIRLLTLHRIGGCTSIRSCGRPSTKGSYVTSINPVSSSFRGIHVWRFR